MQPSKGFVELWRGVAYPWECDHMGHMNVQFYAAKCAEAASWLAHCIGLSPSAAKREQRSLVPAEDYVRYLREVRAGDVLVVRGAVLAATDGALEYALEMIDAASDEVCATSSTNAILTDMRTDRALAWPAAERNRAEALRRDWTGERTPRETPPVPGLASRADRDADLRMGCIDTYRGTVQTWECDRFGRMVPGACTARFNQAAWQFGQALGTGPEFYRAGHFSAALYYHIHYHQPARAGDVLTMLSGLTAHGSSRHRYLHKLYDAANGALVATADAIGIHIDPHSRRPAPWPEDVVRRSRARLIVAAA